MRSAEVSPSWSPGVGAGVVVPTDGQTVPITVAP